MSEIKIELIQLGDTYPVNYGKIKKFGEGSSIFKIIDISVSLNANILNENPHQLSDKDFNFSKNLNSDTHFSVVIVNRPLEGNYFTRIISENRIVVSIFEIEKLDIHEGISVEMYIIRFLFAFSTIFKAFNGIPLNECELMQNNATGCLFDKSIFKPQIAIFFRQPKISSAAINALNSKELPQNFLNDLQHEIKKLKIGPYYDIKDWLKKNPIWAILIIYLVGIIFSEILGNYAFNLIQDFLPFKNTVTTE